jgi:hypothetical protein
MNVSEDFIHMSVAAFRADERDLLGVTGHSDYIPCLGSSTNHPVAKRKNPRHTNFSYEYTK